MSACRSCDAPILWATNVVTGRRLPLDPAPDLERGNVIVDPRTDPARCKVLDQEASAQARREGAATYRSHFATCPNAAAHRSTRGRG